MGYCPFCGAPSYKVPQRIPPTRLQRYIRRLKHVYPALLIIFLIAASSLVQFIVGSLLAAFGLVLEGVVPNTAEDGLFILLTVITGTLVMIVLLLKGIPFSFDREHYVGFNSRTLVLLGALFGVTISVVEISVSLIDIGLDLFRLDPIQATPYDVFFMDPVNIVLFVILGGIVGPTFEELVFRRYAISMLLTRRESEAPVIVTSALIFSLMHLPGDLQVGSLRYIILHLTVTFILGVILGAIYIRWGFLHAVVFHSAWNMFSVAISLAGLANLEVWVDIGIIIVIVVSFSGLLVGSYMKRTLLKETFGFLSLPPRTDFLPLFANLCLFIIFEIVPVVILLVIPNFITIGLAILTQILALLAGPLVILEIKRTRITQQEEFPAVSVK